MGSRAIMTAFRPTAELVFKAALNGELSFFQDHANEDGFIGFLLNVIHRKSGDTLLHFAVRNDHLRLVKFLITEGLNPETANFDGKTPLHEGAQYESVHCVKYLLSLKVKINALKRADWTPLMLACTKKNNEVVSLLLQAGADTTLKNKDGWNCFHIAVREGYIPVIENLLMWNKSLWSTVSKNGRTPLHTAALHGHTVLVQYLLDNCCYETDTKDSCGSTPLMDAIRAEHLDVAKVLIREHKISALNLAKPSKGEPKQIRLITIKANVNMLDNLGRSPLHLAAQAGATESIRFLVQDCGIKPDSPCVGNDVTALHIAAKENHSEAVLLLLSFGVNVNVTDNKGRTALHIASGAQHIECVRILLQNKADNRPDNSGTSPDQLARKSEIVQLFQTVDVT